MTANRVRHGGCPAAGESLPLGPWSVTPKSTAIVEQPPPVQDTCASETSDSTAAQIDWRVSVPGLPAIVGTARHLVRSVLTDSPRLDDVELVTSELVTNAIRHTPSGDNGSTVSLRILAAPGWVRIEVSDFGSACWSEPSIPGEYDENGRGLIIVNALADRSGHEATARGQISWAEISWGDLN